MRYRIFTVLILVLFVLLSACQGPTGPAGSLGALDEKGEQTPSQRAAGKPTEESTDWTVDRVLDLRRAPHTSENVMKLRQALETKDGHVRILAAESLARWQEHPEQSLPILVAVLDSASLPSVRNAPHAEDWLRVAAGAVGHYGPSAAPATTSLISVLTDGDYNVRGYAARSLGQVGPQAGIAVPYLEKAIERETITEVRDLMLEAVARIRFKQ